MSVPGGLRIFRAFASLFSLGILVLLLILETPGILKPLELVGGMICFQVEERNKPAEEKELEFKMCPPQVHLNVNRNIEI